MPGYRVVARADQIPEGRGLRVELDGIELGLFRVAGRVFALENRCPHAGDPLSEGSLSGCIVTCAAHGWRFDLRTGFRPGYEDGFPIPCFPVRVEAGLVAVDIRNPLNLGRPARG